jgi:hypothetical protein
VRFVVTPVSQFMLVGAEDYGTKARLFSAIS